MSVEIANTDGVSESHETKAQNCNSFGEPINGVSNGHHGSSSKHHHKSSSKDKHKDKVRDKEHKSSSKSSSNRDKHSSSSGSKDKEKDKDRHHGSSSSKDKEKDRDKHKSSSGSGHHKSSSSHRDKDRDRHKDKDKKESSKSGGDKEKERRKDHKSSSSRDKDKERHHKSSSSSKNKHSNNSKSSSSKDRNDLGNADDTFLKPEPIIKENGDIPEIQLNIPRNDYDESCSGYEASNLEHKYEEKYNNGYAEAQFKQEHEINISQASSCDYSMSQFKSDEPAFVIKEEMKNETSDEYDDENDVSTFKQEPISVICQNNESDEDKCNLSLSKRKASAKVVYKEEEDEDGEDDEDIPLSKRKKSDIKDEEEEEEYNSEEEDEPINRKKQKISKKLIKNEKTATKNKKYQNNQKAQKRKESEEVKPSPSKRQKKQEGEDENEVWRWWEEEKRADGVKWTTLEHKGPVFAPPYEPLPKNVHFYYDGKPMKLSEATEEVATFYAKMLNHEYVTKPVFNDNFFKDFRKTMTSHEREIIKDLRKCNFQEMFEYFTAESEKRKNATKDEKNAKKAENEALVKEYGFCIIDGHKEKIGNFKLEPPGLFRGRGEHPKMGMVKRRIMASDVSINCGKDSKIPVPPKGQKWKDVRSDNTVTWLASWIENVQGQVKYIMLNPSSKLKGEKDHIKYETARKLDKHINKIRTTYREEWKSKEMRVRQRAVALYFIDKLALRAGNEKDEDQADTVGCCSLRVEHVSLHKQMNGKENVVVFDFLGKDSIRYYNEVEVEKRVFKNLELFMENKKDGDDLFDRLNTQVLNEHLKELMEGLTAKVFRTYNASITLQAQLDELTDPDSTIPEKLLSYNRANRAVAILCNHQRSVPKGHAKSMENLKEKIRTKREAIDDAENEYYDLKKAAKRGSVKERIMADKKQKQIERLKEQLKKLELQETDRDENKTIALGTSKLNYLDPRISVAWCKKHGVPIEKIFNKTQREKFRWAIHMADKNYRF